MNLTRTIYPLGPSDKAALRGVVTHASSRTCLPSQISPACLGERPGIAFFSSFVSGLGLLGSLPPSPLRSSSPSSDKFTLSATLAPFAVLTMRLSPPRLAACGCSVSLCLFSASSSARHTWLPEMSLPAERADCRLTGIARTRTSSSGARYTTFAPLYLIC